MKDIDRAFLNNFIQFDFLGHIVSSIGLYECGKNYEQTATLMRFHTDKTDYNVANDKAKKFNDGVRVQNIVIAKLFAEWISSMEDFGALCWSIKNRNKSTILKKYADSQQFIF